MFEDFDSVYSYSIDDAIADGSLIQPYPDKLPWLLITPGILEASKVASGFEDVETQQVLIPLLLDACIEAKRQSETGAEAIHVILEGTCAGTVWAMPNEMGGLTVMLPSEY